MILKRFFASLLLLAIGFVVQIKWGNGWGLLGTPLVVGSLTAMGAVLAWEELLFLTILTVYAMNWKPMGIPPVLYIYVATPLAVWGILYLESRSDPKKFKSTHKPLFAALGAAIAVMILAFLSHPESMISVAVLIGITVAVLWSFLVLQFLEIYTP